MPTKNEDIVSCEVDLNNPPPLTPEQEAAFEALRRKPDDEIDFSDIPPFRFDEYCYMPGRLTRAEVLAARARAKAALAAPKQASPTTDKAVKKDVELII